MVTERQHLPRKANAADHICESRVAVKRIGKISKGPRGSWQGSPESFLAVCPSYNQQTDAPTYVVSHFVLAAESASAAAQRLTCCVRLHRFVRLCLLLR